MKITITYFLLLLTTCCSNLYAGDLTAKNHVAGVIGVSPSTIYDNDVAGGAQGIDRTVTISNTGSTDLTVTAISLAGTNAGEFILSGLPAFPATIATGTSINFLVTFNPSTKGIKTAAVNISSDDAATPVTSVSLRGLGTTGLGGANEPSLQSILDLYQIQVNVGDDNSSTNVINSNTTLQKANLLGDEISIQKFQKAGSGNVTITPLSVFGPTDSSTVVGFGWYNSGNYNSKSELLTVSNSPLSNGQTVNVNYSGTLVFDPASASFGFYSRWPFFKNRALYSEDELNTFTGSAPHHVRVYPYIINGVTVADSYVVGFEETTSALDYQDFLFIVSNVKPATATNASIFAENLNKFPSNDELVFSRVQVPWSRDGINYNANHDSITLRIHNNGISPLKVTGLILSNDTTWTIEKLKGNPYVEGTSLPITINSGNSADVVLRFIAEEQGTRVKVLKETLTIVSNDDKTPGKTITLHGLWQRSGEGNNEPYAQEIISAFGYSTKTGFNHTDPDLGDSTKLKGDEIKPSYFLAADTSLPVTARQLSAYHGCCTFTEKLMWFDKQTLTLKTVFTHIAPDGQTLMPRKTNAGALATGSFQTSVAFGFKVGSQDHTDATLNPNNEIGIRVWRVYDTKGNLVPNEYIISNDYLGTSSTNYDYNDNTYLVTNLKPEIGTAYYSALGTDVSDLDFGEKMVNSNNSLQLNLSSLGQTYSDGSSDPVLKISAVEITGENKSEFSASLPAITSLSPQQATTMTINFKPKNVGLKIADLLIYYDNALSPTRVPLYGIGSATDTIIAVSYRVNSGASSPITINGKTWSADDQYSFDNLEPYINPNVHSIAGTDEDSLYFDEQSSDADRMPFRYQFPVQNGNYAVRLHFAEVYWGQPGSGIAGGEGSRTFTVKIENQTKLVNYDITKDVGGATAVIKNFPVTVTDGNLNIDFSAAVNRPAVSAIEVYSFTPLSPLSLDFIDFKGILNNNKVELEWKTANEVNTKYFEVEKSNDNTDFKSIGTVTALNNASTVNTYNFIDDNPGTPYNYYRIKEVDQDGRVTYSKIIRIDLSASFALKLLPNPVGNKLQIMVSGIEGNQKATLSVLNSAGSKLKFVPVTLSNQKLEVDVSSLSAGMYIMKLTSDKFTITKKFLKK